MRSLSCAECADVDGGDELVVVAGADEDVELGLVVVCEPVDRAWEQDPVAECEPGGAERGREPRAGKSTFLKAVVGLARIFSGRITVDGERTTGQPLETLVRRGIGYVPQSQDVFGNLRVIENLEMGGYLLTDRQRKQRIDEILDIFPALRNMTRRYVRTMSGGEQKMTAVARALMLSPRLLILDEPTAGLSTSLTQTVLQEQARQLADNGTAVLLVEQKGKTDARDGRPCLRLRS